ncbi:hypothetical protein UFOVP201_29 [uncultured Caudovirales phage]|uniref:Uncharacterized protein n=1 Tax=uncultured Caudovirales phage TaxID=2100421 RepID=A0A6J7WMN0_9CAUD|nr:hypothetical protein UFOVP201_29 [uncultured Caudovirales phage]
MATPVNMTNQTYGVAHKFAVYSTVDFVTLQTDNLNRKPALDVEIMDETGRVITDRLDDVRSETSISGVLKTGGTIPTVMDRFTYDGLSYIIKDVTDDGQNNAFRKVTLKLVKYQEIA